jgi:glucose/arabinose dehydrogenase
MKPPALAIVISLVSMCSQAAGEDELKPLVTGLPHPTEVTLGPGGRLFVLCADGKGGPSAATIQRIDGDKAVLFATGLNEARCLLAFQQWLFVIESTCVKRIDRRGKVEVFVDASAFPRSPPLLGRAAVDMQSGTIYACDDVGEANTIYAITQEKKVSVVRDAKRSPPVNATGLAMDGASHLILLDGAAGQLHCIKIADGSSKELTGGLNKAVGLAWDQFGRLFIGGPNRRLTVIPRPGQLPMLMTAGLGHGNIFCLGPSGKDIIVADPIAGTLTAVPAVLPGAEVDERPLTVGTEPAFPDLHWSGWNKDGVNGKPDPLRPILLTHAGDGSDRVFVATQQGVVHVFANDQRATETKIFLDLHDKVAFDEKMQEEGLLGLAFHPHFKQNGEFFVFYTTKHEKLTNVVSRFRVSVDDPSRADPRSEEEVLRFKKVSWNHDGGTVCFGPDGYLYITHGDGGLQMDPYDNGQNLSLFLGKVLRIDVDHKAEGKNYAVPADNPFIDRADARPEIWSYGQRNVWRMAFDRQTGVLWAGDVGESLYEEIDLIQRGGNYGWNRREGLHPFGPKGEVASDKFIEPIWEYRHDVGACIVGGCVYRGKRLPELLGYYVYADFTNGKLWALRYDPKQARVMENRPIKDNHHPIWSFGEDEQGEVFLLSAAADGRGIFRFARASEN